MPAERDERRVPLDVDGRGVVMTPAWMVEKLYERALERGDDRRAEKMLDALTKPRNA